MVPVSGSNAYFQAEMYAQILAVADADIMVLGPEFVALDNQFGCSRRGKPDLAADRK